MNVQFKKNGVEINQLSQWEKLGHPMSSIHWKKGRSAWEMGVYAIEHTDEFKEHIESILSECKICIQDFIGEPEAIAGLGRGMNRGSRNHDLLMIGSKNCVIGIEAKVSESFDRPINRVMAEQSKNYNGNIEKTRPYKLAKFLTPDEPFDSVGQRGYQLFTATRAIMCNAYTQNYENAILLIIVFTGNVEKEKKYEDKCRYNDEDVDYFKKAIGVDDNDMITRKIEGKSINCWIKKIKIHLPNYILEKNESRSLNNQSSPTKQER